MHYASTSKLTLVCFPCHYTAKAAFMDAGKYRRCPKCSLALTDVGKRFRIPTKNDNKGWKNAEARYNRKDQEAIDFNDPNPRKYEVRKLLNRVVNDGDLK